MHPVALRSVAVAFALIGAAPGARAQVTVNPGVLDGLGGASPRTAPQRQPASPRPAQPPRNAAPRPAQPPPRPPPPPVPTNPPPSASVPPSVVVPTAPPAPPAPVSVLADAPGAASQVLGGTRITFGPDRSDLNPATESALRSFARAVKDDQSAVNVHAYAAGGPEDPSTPRRLSLARALAARAVLISEGIVSTRIYVRALGASVPDGPADRVDVVRAAAPARAEAR